MLLPLSAIDERPVLKGSLTVTHVFCHLGRESMLIVDQIEIDTFICYIRAFVFLATREYHMLSKVFPPASCSKTFDSLIQVRDASKVKGEGHNPL